jgi:hypothetical protein
LPNTLGWIHREVFDFEEALRLNREGIGMAREFGFSEGEVNSRINLAHDCIAAGDAPSAGEHLQAAEGLLRTDSWFRWVYRTRLESEFAHYWLARGDLQRAGLAAEKALELAQSLRRRKYIAWTRKLLGDIAVAEERYAGAQAQYAGGLQALEGHPCPSVEWQIFDALARMHARLHRNEAADENRARARDTLRRLADSLRDERLRALFLASRPARELKVPG